MPRTHVVFYREDDERVPVLDWLKELRASDHRAYETCVAAIERLGSRTKEAGCGLPERRHSRATGKERPCELQDPLFFSREKPFFRLIVRSTSRG